MVDSVLERCRSKEQSFMWYAFKGVTVTGSGPANAAVKDDPESVCNAVEEIMKPHCTLLEVGHDVSSDGTRTYIAVTYAERPKGKKALEKAANAKGKSVVFIFSHEQDVLFANIVQLKSALANALCEALSFESIQRLPLDGRDIESLIKMCAWKGKKRVPVPRVGLNMSVAERPPAKKRKLETLEKTGQHEIVNLDRTRQQEKAKYFEQHFPSDHSPLLQKFSVEAKKENPDAPDGTSTFKLEITTSNLVETLQKMMDNGALPKPMPKYLESLLTCGKNHVKIGAQGN